LVWALYLKGLSGIMLGQLAQIGIDLLRDIEAAARPWLPIVVGLVILFIADKVFHKRISELFTGLAREVRQVAAMKTNALSLNLVGAIGLFVFIIVFHNGITELILETIQGLHSAANENGDYILMASMFLLAIYFLTSIHLGKYHRD
jgi:hypothetical protein